MRSLFCLCLFLLLSLVGADHSCSCYYEFPASGPYAVTECVGDEGATCSCPELTNPLLNTVEVRCPGKVVIQGVPGFDYDSRALCTRLTPVGATTVPTYLLPCVGAQCGGNTTGTVSFISAVTRTLNATVPLCSFTTRTERCVDRTSCAEQCQVSNWSPWTGCSRTCGSGATRHRTRRILRLPLGQNETSCPVLRQTLSCDSVLPNCSTNEPTWNATSNERNCTASEVMLAGSNCRVICSDSTRYLGCQFFNRSVDSDLYRRCGLHALAFNGSLCACASPTHVTSFSGLPCNGIRTQCDATDGLSTNVSTWVTSCTSSEALSSLTGNVDFYSRKREVDLRCRSNQTCPPELFPAGYRRCANVSEVNATCGLPNANASCFISCWTASECRGVSSDCTCPVGAVRDPTRTPPCYNASYVRNCTDVESTVCDGCVAFSSPGVCSMGTQCLVNCSTSLGECRVIPSTCGNTTTRRVACQDIDRLRYCGASAVACFVTATENKLTGTLETFPETIECACGNDQVPVPTLAGRPRIDQWGYGIPCASTSTLDIPCTRDQLEIYCDVALGGEADTFQWDPRFCLQRNGRFVNGTCPDDYNLRNCTDDEFYRYCPLPEHVGCRMACDRANDTSCRLFGRCAVTRPCTADEAVLHCNRFATNCTLQQWDEPIVGRRTFVNRSTCTYQCELPWYGDDCSLNYNDGVCALDRWAWFCGAPWQASNCQSLNVTTVQCTCRSDYGNPIPVFQNLSLASAQLLPYCSGLKRACTADEVPLYAGPYGASCFLYCHEVLTTDCALANYTCLPGSFPELRDAWVQQSANVRGTVFVPCSTNRQTLLNYDEPALVQRLCGRGGLSVDVVATYNGSTIESYDIVNGTCRCIDGYFARGSVPCHSLYYTRDCTATERALVPFELLRDCPSYVCRRLCYPPRGTAQELCFAHEPNACLDNYVSLYWAQVPRALALQQCGDFVDLAYASCSFASDLKFSARCSGKVQCHCRTDVNFTLAYQNTSVLDIQRPCDEIFQVQPCADQWEALQLCQSVFAQNCTRRFYPSTTRAPEAHTCQCTPGFSVSSSVRRCATNVSGEVCPTNSKYFPPTTCGPLSFGVDYICDAGAPVLSCLTTCKCLPGAITFFDGIPCSGYRRNCSLTERYRYCATTDAVCEMECAASHAYGGSPLPCRRVTPLPCPSLTPVDTTAIPADKLERDCGKGALTCSYNPGFFRCNTGTCRCKPWPLGALVAGRCEVPVATYRPCWTIEPWLTTAPTYSCTRSPIPIVIPMGPFQPPRVVYPITSCNTEPDPVETLDPQFKIPGIATQAYCGENARSCRMRRFFLPSVIGQLASIAMRVVQDGYAADVDFKWLLTYLNASIDPTTNGVRRVFVNPLFRCSLERPTPYLTPFGTTYYGRKIWCFRTANTALPGEFFRDTIIVSGAAGTQNIANLNTIPFNGQEPLWPDSVSPFSYTPFPGQSFDDPFEYSFFVPECMCGGHPFSWTEREGTWHTFFDPDGLAPLRPPITGAWTTYPWHTQFLDRMRCERRHEIFERAQGTCSRAERSRLTCNGMGHCRSWRHALQPICKEYQNMYGFCLKERLYRSVYTEVEYSMLRYTPNLEFFLGTPNRVNAFRAWWSTLTSRGGIDPLAPFKAAGIDGLDSSGLTGALSLNLTNAWWSDAPSFLSLDDWKVLVGGLLAQIEVYSRNQICGRGTFTANVTDLAKCDQYGFNAASSDSSFARAGCAFYNALFGYSADCPPATQGPPWAIELAFAKRSNFDSTPCGAFVRDLLSDKLQTGDAIPEGCATLLYIIQGLPWLSGEKEYQYLNVQESGDEDKYVQYFRYLFREGLSSTVDAEYLARLYHRDFKHYLRNYVDGIAQAGPQSNSFETTRLGSNVLLLQMLQKLGACPQTVIRDRNLYRFNCSGYYEPYCKRTGTNGACLEWDKKFIEAPSFFELIMQTNLTYPRNVRLTDLKCGNTFMQVVNCGVFSNYTGSCALAFNTAAYFYQSLFSVSRDLGVGNQQRLNVQFFSPLYSKRLLDIERTTANFGTSSGASFCGAVPCNCKISGWIGTACNVRSCTLTSTSVDNFPPCSLGFHGLCETDKSFTNISQSAFVGVDYMIQNSWDGQYKLGSCCEGGTCTLPFNWTGRSGCGNGYYDWVQARCICDATWKTDSLGRCVISQCTSTRLGCLNGGICNPSTLRCYCAQGFYGSDCAFRLATACVGGCGNGECTVVPGTVNQTTCTCATSRYSPGIPLPAARCPDPPPTGTWELDAYPETGTCRYIDRTVFKYERGPDVDGSAAFPCALVECLAAGNCYCRESFVDPQIRTSGSTIVDREKLCPRSAFPFPYERDEVLFKAPNPVCAAIIKLTNFSDPDTFYEWRGTRCDTPWAPCLNGGTPTAEPVYHDPYRVTCVCTAAFTGRFCEWPVCPRSRTNVTCSGYDQNQCASTSNQDCRVYDPFTNGLRCTRNGTVDFSRQGCGCTHELRDGCQQPGTSSICSGIIQRGSDGQFVDTCQPYVDPLAGAIRYRCLCPPGRSGTWCEETVCPVPPQLSGILTSACNGRSCLANGTCSCDNTGLSLPSDRILEGPDCEYDVTDQCGYNPPGTTSLLPCSNHGQCVYNATAARFQCRCESGYTGEFCQRSACAVDCLFGDCVPTNNGIDSICRCWNSQVYRRSTSGACNQSACGQAFPNAAGTKCVCNNSLLAPPDCSANLCYRTPITNQLCGPLAAGDQYDVNSRTFADGARETIDKQCVDGACVCGWRYRYTTNQTRCEPICNVTNTITTLMEMDATGRLPRDANGIPVLRFGSCVCKEGYTSESNCTQIKCQRGARLNPDGSCNCTSVYTGSACETFRCEGRGTALPSGEACVCNYPFIGTFCEDIDPLALVCRNNGTVLNATQCSCPFPYTGRSCTAHVCENGGTPIPGACVCPTDRWTGPTCSLRQCLNRGQLINNDTQCRCTTQYHGDFCERRFCNTGGNRVVLPNQNSSVCFCSGLWRLDPGTNNCTQSSCVNGVPSVSDASSCVCKKPYVDRGAQYPNHRCRLDCEVDYGVYDEETSTCLCDDRHFGVLCEKSIAEAIELNATTGQTHDVPLGVNETVTISNPPTRSNDSSFYIDPNDNTTSDRDTPLPTTPVGGNGSLSGNGNNTVENATFPAYPIGEPLPIGSTTLGVVGTIGGTMLVGLFGVVALFAV